MAASAPIREVLFDTLAHRQFLVEAAGDGMAADAQVLRFGELPTDAQTAVRAGAREVVVDGGATRVRLIPGVVFSSSVVTARWLLGPDG